MLSLKIKNLSYQYNINNTIIYNDHIFHTGISIIQGKSGIGKTTLFSLLIQKIYPITGEILYNNININKYTKEEYYENVVSYVIQGGMLSSYFSLAEYIVLIKKNNQNHLSNNIIEQYISLLALNKIINQNVSECSGGEKYKIALLINLIKNTPILLLDEPTSHLDERSSLEVKKIIENEKKTKIIIIITHDSLFFNNKNYHYYNF